MLSRYVIIGSKVYTYMYNFLLPEKLGEKTTPENSYHHIYSDALLHHLYFTKEIELMFEVVKVLTEITASRIINQNVKEKVKELEILATKHVNQMLSTVKTKGEYGIFNSFNHFTDLNSISYSVEKLQGVLNEIVVRIMQIDERIDEIKDLFEDDLSEEVNYLSQNYEKLTKQLENLKYNSGVKYYTQMREKYINKKDVYNKLWNYNPFLPLPDILNYKKLFLNDLNELIFIGSKEKVDLINEYLNLSVEKSILTSIANLMADHSDFISTTTKFSMYYYNNFKRNKELFIDTFISGSLLSNEIMADSFYSDKIIGDVYNLRQRILNSYGNLVKRGKNRQSLIIGRYFYDKIIQKMTEFAGYVSNNIGMELELMKESSQQLTETLTAVGISINLIEKERKMIEKKFDEAVQNAYNKGYKEGYSKGSFDGYHEGYEDGEDIARSKINRAMNFIL
jgi:gas vesicle protein